MNSIYKIKALLEQYKEELTTEFSFYDSDKKCLAITSGLINEEFQKESAMISIEVGKDVFHLTTPSRKDKDFLMLVAIACKHLLQVDRQELSSDEQLKLALLGQLTNDELLKLSQEIDWTCGKQLFLLEMKQDSLEDAKELTNNIISGELYILNNQLLLITDFQEKPIAFANNLIDTLSSECMINVSCCIGDEMKSLEEAQKNYEQLLHVARLRCIFYPDKLIMTQDRLGIARLISAIPQETLKTFLKSIQEMEFESIDNEEDLRTINTFFECDLNVSKTAQQLYLHRNTLIYRLDKYQKEMGLDVRKFDDAMKFKLYLMIYQLLKK